MKVIGITGSPREKSNTEYYVNYTLKEIKKHGLQTELIRLRDIHINPCTGCYGCIEAKKCIQQNDDFEKIFNKLAEADGILFGSPVYNGSVTSNLKALMDRAGFSGRWAENDMKDKNTNYNWGGTIFSGKVAAPITVARRAGHCFAFAQILLWLTVNDFIVAGSSYWNVGVAGKGGAVDAQEDKESESIFNHLAQNMVTIIKQMKK